MDLILWRHAHAEALPSEPDAFTSKRLLWAQDAQRRLTPKGQRQAEQMADWLRSRLRGPVMIWASPALRTQETAAALKLPFETQLALAPHLSVEEICAVMPWPDAQQTLILVGHQPTLGTLASRLLCGQDQPWSVKKGGIWWLKSRTRQGQAGVTLHAVQNPDLL